MTPEVFSKTILLPGLEWLSGLGGPLPSTDAARFLLSVAYTESNLEHRAQIVTGGGPGPARGFWQFERGGGVAGVMNHPTTRDLARKACAEACVEYATPAVWAALRDNDPLAASFARLLLLTDPKTIPVKEADAWGCYALRLWRPGKPHRDRFAKGWAEAVKVYG